MNSENKNSKEIEKEKEKKKKRARRRVTIALIIALIILILLLLHRCTCKPIVDPTAPTGSNNYVEHNGKWYSPNQSITTVLYAGVDSTEDLTTYNRYSIAPRADTIALVVFDDYHKTTSVVSISRDTMTDVRRYTMNGTYRDTYVTHLGYAYSYGDGGKVSCDNLLYSVSQLFGGQMIHDYAISNNGSLIDLNRLAGGITVTVPNNDLAETYPELTAGNTVKLNDNNVVPFIRYRNGAVDFSNNNRMERQKAFMNGFIAQFQQKVHENKESVWNQIDSMKGYMQTSITKNKYLSLADKLLNDVYSEANFYMLPGQNVKGTSYDEFWVDQEALEDLIFQLFYIEEGAVTK